MGWLNGGLECGVPSPENIETGLLAKDAGMECCVSDLGVSVDAYTTTESGVSLRGSTGKRRSCPIRSDAR